MSAKETFEKDGKTYQILSKTLPKDAGHLYFYCHVSPNKEGLTIDKVETLAYAAGKQALSDLIPYTFTKGDSRIHFTVNGHLVALTGSPVLKENHSLDSQVGQINVSQQNPEPKIVSDLLILVL